MEPEYPPTFFKVTKTKKKATSNGLPKASWRKEHDDFLATLATENQGKNWNNVSEKMNARFPELHACPKKCRERWLNCANPEVRRTALSEEEELALIMYHYIYHNRWAVMAKRIPNRSSTSLKNNFYSLIRRHLRTILLSKETMTTPESRSITSITSALEFLQCVFSVIIIVELLRLKEPPSAHNGIAPPYIYELVKEKRVTEAMCITYLGKSINEFVGLMQGKPILAKLRDEGTVDKISAMYKRLVEKYNECFSTYRLRTEELIVMMLENTLSPAEPETMVQTRMEEDLKTYDTPMQTAVQAAPDLMQSIPEPVEEPKVEIGACCSGGTICQSLKVCKKSTEHCYIVAPGETMISSLGEYPDLGGNAGEEDDFQY